MKDYYKGCDTKWKREFVDEVLSATNEELLDQTLYWYAGDDYDGCHTERGEWCNGKRQEILIDKLTDIGFLTPNQSLTPKN